MVGRRIRGQQLCGSRIVIGILVGIAFGCVCAVMFPYGSFHSASSLSVSDRVAKSSFQVGSPRCESPERLKMLRAENAALSEKNSELKKRVRELTEKLRLAEQGRDSVRKQVSVSGLQVKAGPFGTVRSSSTNPTVLHDESVNPRLAKILEKVAVGRELIVVLANWNVERLLKMQLASVMTVGISNYLVVALDDETEKFCLSYEIAYYRRDPDKEVDTIGKNGTNHAVSALKFRVLREFLQLGYAVLLSDVDIVYLQNPFEHLYRDSDVEAMSDGHNNITAYGYDELYDEPAMGWARYAHTIRIWVFNSGFFYLRPTIPAIELIDRVAEIVAQSGDWDQAVFNEELFFPSHPGYKGVHASKRVMDMYEFMNSKVLFKTVRKDPELKKMKPVIVHMNYHPDKFRRLQAVVEFYVDGVENALDDFSDGFDMAGIEVPIK